jgi:hypothetical protein
MCACVCVCLSVILSVTVSPEDPHIQSFWRVLRTFSAAQRQQFLRFVWARSRLPTTSSEFTQKFKMQGAVPEPAVPGAVTAVASTSAATDGGAAGASAAGVAAAPGSTATLHGMANGTTGAATAATAAAGVAGPGAGGAEGVSGMMVEGSALRSASSAGFRTARRVSTVGLHAISAVVSPTVAANAAAPGAGSGASSTVPRPSSRLVSDAASMANAPSTTAGAALHDSAAVVAAPSAPGGDVPVAGGASGEVEGLPMTARRRPSSAMRSARRSFVRRPSSMAMHGAGLATGVDQTTTTRSDSATGHSGGDAVGAVTASALSTAVPAPPAPASLPFTGVVDVVTCPDLYLPKAHTCFFSLNLPKYTTDQVRASLRN